MPTESVRTPSEVLYKTKNARKTVCFDYQREGAVKAAVAANADPIISNPVLTFESGSGLTAAAGTLIVIAAEFLDGADGEPCPAGQGVSVRVLGGNVGTWEASCIVDVHGGDTAECIVRLKVTNSPA